MSKIILSNNFIRAVCKLALNEDLYPSGDITSNLLKNNTKKKGKKITLPKVLDCLENETNEIILDQYTIEKARKSVERMAEIGR